MHSWYLLFITVLGVAKVVEQVAHSVFQQEIESQNSNVHKMLV